MYIFKVSLKTISDSSLEPDGSKDQGHIVAAGLFRQLRFSVHIPDQSLVLTVKTWALCLALECIEDSNYTNYVVYRDSFSCLQAGLKSDHPFIAKVIFKMNQLCWGLAMLASEEMRAMIGLRKRLQTMMLNRVWYPILIWNHTHQSQIATWVGWKH